MVVGLTGGIASGKSTVSNYFKTIGVTVIDADIISREVAKTQEVLEKVAEEFGEDAVQNGELNRKLIGNLIFENSEKREILNKIMHPAILSEINTRISNENNKKNLIIVDVPLLYETKIDKIMDKVIVVFLDKELQLQRLMKRDNLSLDDAVRRVESQMSLEEKVQRADILIKNDSCLEDLRIRVEEIYEQLI